MKTKFLFSVLLLLAGITGQVDADGFPVSGSFKLPQFQPPDNQCGLGDGSDICFYFAGDMHSKFLRGAIPIVVTVDFPGQSDPGNPTTNFSNNVIGPCIGGVFSLEDEATSGAELYGGGAVMVCQASKLVLMTTDGNYFLPPFGVTGGMLLQTGYGMSESTYSGKISINQTLTGTFTGWGLE